MNRPGSVAVRADTREIARNRGITRVPQKPRHGSEYGYRYERTPPKTADTGLAYPGLGPPALARHIALLQEPP